MSDETPGIRRRGNGKRAAYTWPEGSLVRDAATLARIRSLAVPPAWRDVWICPRDDGHLQATGRDERGRKQYRYHRRWREVRDETKYGRMPAFAHALPLIRRRVRMDLSLPGMPREKVLATVVRLLESTLIRVGNEEYARRNASFGLTTLRDRQVRVRGDRLKFRFRGKSGVHHDIELEDARLARIVRRMQDLPGEELVQYVDDDGSVRRIESADVNAYLKEITGQEFTSKDFRTWAGTLLAARALRRVDAAGSRREAQRNLKVAIAEVAGQLGNTVAVCRKCYVHPAIVDAFLEGSLAEHVTGRSETRGLLRLLSERARREASLARRSGAGNRSLVPALAQSLAKRGRGKARRLRAQVVGPSP